MQIDPGIIRSSAVLLGAMLLATAAHALDEGGAKQVIDKFLGAQKLDQASASANRHAIADVNGDGKPDIVLLWDVLGPTWSLPKMSIFIDQGRNYRTITTDLQGQIEGLAVRGSTISIDTLTPGPKDPRCCPTVKKQLQYQWTSNKLVIVK